MNFFHKFKKKISRPIRKVRKWSWCPYCGSGLWFYFSFHSTWNCVLFYVENYPCSKLTDCAISTTIWLLRLRPLYDCGAAGIFLSAAITGCKYSWGPFRLSCSTPSTVLTRQGTKFCPNGTRPHPISWCRLDQTYCYVNEVFWEFSTRDLPNAQCLNISKGCRPDVKTSKRAIRVQVSTWYLPQWYGWNWATKTWGFSRALGSGILPLGLRVCY